MTKDSSTGSQNLNSQDATCTTTSKSDQKQPKGKSVSDDQRGEIYSSDSKLERPKYALVTPAAPYRYSKGDKRKVNLSH